MHAKGLVHRDIKPSNILIIDPPPETPDQLRCKLLDFGVVWHGADSTLTGRAQPGTVDYRAPELSIAGSGEPTPESDLFGLGKVLYWAVTGTPPVFLYNLDPPSKLLDGLPDKLDEPLLSCFGAPEMRPASAGAVADVFDGLLSDLEAEEEAEEEAEGEGLGAQGEHEQPLNEKPEPAPRSRGRWSWVGTGMAGGCVLAGLGAGLLFLLSVILEGELLPLDGGGYGDASSGDTTSEAVASEEETQVELEPAEAQPAEAQPAEAHPEDVTLEEATPEERTTEEAAQNEATPEESAFAPSSESSSVIVQEVRWIDIPGGTYRMGTSPGKYYLHSVHREHEKPVHDVEIQSFQMTETEVTVGQYAACVVARECTWNTYEPGYNQTACNHDAGGPVEGREFHPMNCISWFEARKFAQFKGARLPSESEWEYAARAGHTTKRAGAKSVSEVAWCCLDHDVGTHPVGQLSPNALGLYDTIGNVEEWCEDDYHDSYNGAPVDGGAWIDTPRGSRRQKRGSHWADCADECRVCERVSGFPERAFHSTGFRLARTIP